MKESQGDGQQSWPCPPLGKESLPVGEGEKGQKRWMCVDRCNVKYKDGTKKAW